MSKSRIKTVEPEHVSGPEKAIIDARIAEYGFVPGIARLLLPDRQVAMHASPIYQHLHLRPDSPLTRLQREMIATVVNGLVGGAS